MSENPTTTTRGPWQLLILDADREDPKVDSRDRRYPGRCGARAAG